MAFNVLQNSEQRTGFFLSVFFGPTAILATILRLIATKRHNRKLGWDDWHALLALFTFLPYIGYTLWLFDLVNGRSPLQFAMDDPMGIQQALKVGNIMNGIYGIQQSFCKFSLLALYHRLFWVNRGFTATCWGVAIVQGALGAVILLVHIFACRPIAKVWNPMLPGWCIDENIFFSIYEPLNSLLDFIVAGLAIWMLPKLQIGRVTQWHLTLLFLIGAFSGVIGVIKVVEAQNAAQRNFKSILWNIVQMATSIICICAPIYQSILPKTGFYNRVQTWASSTFGSRRSQGSSAAKGSKSNFSSGVNHEDKSGSSSLNQRSQWVTLDGSSERGLAWAEAEDLRKNGDVHDDDRSDIPMGTVRVQRSVDVV